MFSDLLRDAYPPKKHMKYKDFLSKPKLAEIFDTSSEFNQEFLKEGLLRLKPVEASELPGFVYIYCRETDIKHHQDGTLSHIVLYKVGRTKFNPASRIL